MSRKSLSLFAVMAFMVATKVWAESFFARTPLQPVYDALALNNPALAYQELNLAMQKGTLDQTRRHWMEAAVVILQQSQCGRSLVSATSDGNHLRVTYSIRSNPRRQFAYQILVSSLGEHDQLGFDFRDRNGTKWFSGSLAESKEGNVFESPEWLTPFPSGAYTLTVNNKYRYAVFIGPEGNKDWLDPWSHQGVIHLNMPAQIKGCPPVTVSQVWMDEDYTALSAPRVLNHNEEIKLPSEYPKGAVWYSTAVSFLYYHGGIQVEYQQRVTLPVTWLPEKKGQRETTMIKRENG